MASKKSGGTVKNLRDSNPKYLGVKLFGGARAQVGAIILRQRGTKFWPGKNVGMGKDHTIFALKVGRVKFGYKLRASFNGRTKLARTVSVIEEAEQLT